MEMTIMPKQPITFMAINRIFASHWIFDVFCQVIASKQLT
jgi:hypothetical protein